MNKSPSHILGHLLASILLLAGCADAPYSDDVPQLVVEGWIDSDGHPIVFVTTTVPFTSSGKIRTDFASHILNWAKVTVSDGEQTVMLTGRVMRDYPIGYGFTTGQIRGETGKSYRLTVDYGPYHAQAVTTIPPPCRLDSFRCKTPPEVADTLYELHAYASALDLPARGACKFFVMRRHKDTQYISCNMGLFPAQSTARQADFTVNQGHRMKTGKHDKYTPYFSVSDTLLIKFSTTDEAGYRFWKSYEDNISLSSSPFFGSANGLQGNVNGALGYWLGYGTTEYVVWPDTAAEPSSTIRHRVSSLPGNPSAKTATAPDIRTRSTAKSTHITANGRRRLATLGGNP